MEGIDRELQAEGVPIPARPIEASMLICKRLQMSVALLPLKKSPDPVRFGGADLIAHAHAWYEDKYGERLKVDFSPGSMVALIHGDPWLVRFPRIFGCFRFSCIRPQDKAAPDSGRPTLNILAYVRDLTPALCTGLSHTDLVAITRQFVMGFRAVTLLEDLKSSPFVPEACSDLRVAVASVFSTPPDFALSKWHSSQLIEKVIKSFLRQRDRRFANTHNLTELSELAQASGFAPLPSDRLRSVQGTPSMRYGQDNVDLLQAIKAHHSGLYILNHIGAHWIAGPGIRYRD